MAPIKSSLARSAKQLLGLFNTADLGLRGAGQIGRQKVLVVSGGTESSYSGYKVHTFLSNLCIKSEKKHYLILVVY